MKFDWKKTLGLVAPTVATALGGPVAGLAVKALGTFFGLGDGASEDDISAALQNATPEQFAELKKLEQDFKVQMRQLDIDVFKLESDDRANARQRDVQSKDHMNPALAFLILGGFFAMIAALFIWGAPTGFDKVLLGTLVGYVSAKAEQVVAYYFGSSMGSKKKDETLARGISQGRDIGKG